MIDLPEMIWRSGPSIQLFIIYVRLTVLPDFAPETINYNTISATQLRNSGLRLRGKFVISVATVHGTFTWIQGHGREPPK
jgi:hypothetical protein